MSKKTFKENLSPAMNFISAGISEEVTREPVAEKVTSAPATEENVTPKKEAKSKRLNLLLQPSLMEDLGKVAFMKKDSVNNLINTVLTSYRDENRDLVEKYNKVFEV